MRIEPFECRLTLPAWVWEEMAALPDRLETREERVAAVIRFARLNTERGTGGPFAAGVFERDSGQVLMLAVNWVVPLISIRSFLQLFCRILRNSKNYCKKIKVCYV